MLSFGQKQLLLHDDIIIIGTSFAGLSTAIVINEEVPQKQVIVLESDSNYKHQL